MAFPQTFRAYQYENYGSLETELKINSTVPQKPIGAQQVRIKVHSAAIDPVDYLLQGFLGKQVLGKSPSLENSFGIGFDASGEIVKVGGEVKSLNIGDELYAMAPCSAFGTLAEYVLVDEEFVSAKPTSLSFDEAAAIPLSLD
ncbi:2-methylene-furan-3-one reductase [Phytophthora citrophthora]|uniref:2-methylene-furan-3-one reductase n=1 Tax=Phytophthora citrophthora TaxID=4793 RepID=A0AAD9LCV7_9STRA|nr:2-methylene-furan-3-one reductase [Phytophthora citrophthora]